MATPNLQLVQPANNTDQGIWDQPVNANMTVIDTAFGGLAVLNAQGLTGNQPLTLAQYQCTNIVVSGTPAGPVTYMLPGGVGRFFFVGNGANPGSPSVSFASASGGGVVSIPTGASAAVVIDPIYGARLADTIASGAGGTNGQVQVNSGGALAGAAGLTYNAATQGLNVLGPVGIGGNFAIGGYVTGRLIFNQGAANTRSVAIAFSATGMAMNAALSNVFTTTLAGNITGAVAISNMDDGQTINWRLQQDAAGSRTIVWPSNFRWVGGTPGVLTTTAGAVDLLVATYFASPNAWLCSLLKGFA